MTLPEALALLRNAGVPDWFYATDGELGAGECVGIEAVSGVWSIYYSERGRKSPLGTYADEDGACRAFLGSPGVLTDWSADGREVTLTLPDNPLADGVELPPALVTGGLWYSNMLAGALRGALAQVNMNVETSFIADPLLNGGADAAPVAAIRPRCPRRC